MMYEPLLVNQMALENWLGCVVRISSGSMWFQYQHTTNSWEKSTNTTFNLGEFSIVLWLGFTRGG